MVTCNTSGEVQPGSEDWKRICYGAEFAEVWQILKQTDKMNPDRCTADIAAIWKSLENYRNQRCSRKRIRTWHWAAAVVVFAGAVFAGWLTFRGLSPAVLITQNQAETANDSTHVRLVLAGGRQINLSALSGDTLLRQGDAELRLDTAGKITYRRAATSADTVEYNRILVPRKCEFRLTLDDGTQVFLNAGSSLRYPTLFAAGERRIYLEGEGYFNVQRDTTRPFIVETASQRIRVLGTAFNVNAYPGEEMNYTSLQSGRVAVEDKWTGNDWTLLPGQQAVLNRITGETIVREVDIQQIVSWKNGMLVFDDLVLEQIMDKLSYWYDVTVFFRDEEVKEYLFKGNIPRYESLETVLKALEKVSGISFTLNGQVVTISKK